MPVRTRFVSEMSANPRGKPVRPALRMKGGPWEEDDPAASMHLLFQLGEVIPDVQRMIPFLPIRPATRQEDCVSVVERGCIRRPAVKPAFHPDAWQIGRGLQTMPEQDDVLFVLVR